MRSSVMLLCAALGATVVLAYTAKAEWFESSEQPAPSLENEVYFSARIARVTIISKEPAQFGIDPSKPACGFRLHAKIVESFKGGKDELTFYSNSDKLVAGHDYLVFLQKTPGNAQQTAYRLSAFLDPEEQHSLICKLRAASFFLPVDHRAFFSFNHDAAKSLGHEWIDLGSHADSPGVLWCSNDAPYGTAIPRRNIYKPRIFGDGAGASRLLEWTAATTLIRQAIDNPPYVFGEIPNPLFSHLGC